MPSGKTPAQRLAEKELREKLRMGKSPATGKKLPELEKKKKPSEKEESFLDKLKKSGARALGLEKAAKQ